MCESSVYLDERTEVREIMKNVSKIIMEGDDAVCVDVLGERMILASVKLKEANLLSHGIVFTRT
ncbi:MAG: CooT family nickel-binding protein [Methanomassiliicoccales archaeon]|jgi:predicted RNA-binding protein|nr:CooT family nickel-binding protein [Methanomassiliicoccales archaeon]